MNALQDARRPLCIVRDSEQVNVIGHQAPTQNPEPLIAAVARKQVQVSLPIVRTGEDILAVVASRGDVKGHPTLDYSRLTAHNLLVSE